ncbi:MAG TPA: feruloyl-CoA synthase [Burkholderiales bacterium]|nr:feruloyl-CoA synthase [Burkholderiales bacterium]
MSSAPLRRVPMGADDVAVLHRDDGALFLRTPHVLGPYPRNLTERLERWARETPQRVLAAQRHPAGGWRELSYAEAFFRARRVGQALLDRGLSAERPLVVLSENGLEHLLLLLGAMHVGIPCAPVSPAYSLLSSDHGKLRYILSLATPGLVYAQDEARFSKAVGAAVPPGTEVRYGEIPEADATAAVESAHARTGPDTLAKLLFTSGSTGQPKAVINTQRMLCANQQMLAQSLPYLAEVPPVLVDWLPWNHTAGGNHNIGIALYNGGTLYIDEGRPVPGLIETTVRNLREVGPTIYFNVPRGYEALLPYLREDEVLRRTFFGRLGIMQYAAAVLPQPVWTAYDELAVQTCGERVLWITGYGATETAPFTMCTNRGAKRAGTVGLPVDGVEMKLAPVNDKLEARFRGPHITPGYWRQPELTRAAFDEEGYYRTGDAMRFLDPGTPALGLEFDGRLTEDFKLTTGTWVSVGPLRAKLNAAGAPYVQDCVIAGHDRDEVCAMIFPSAACRDLAPAALRAILQGVLDRLAAQSTGSSTRVARALVLEAPPSIDAGEITDKGSINQRAVLRARADLVEMLYSQPEAPQVLKAAA